MNFACFQMNDSHWFGFVDRQNNKVQGIRKFDPAFPGQVNAWIGEFHRAAAPASVAGEWGLREVRLLAPVPAPQKILCIGRNYPEHAQEMGGKVEEIPIIFNKLPTCIIAHEDRVVRPSITDALDYEAELVVVIGRRAKDVVREKAMDYVFGYCCGNDVTARDWQKGKPGGQWLLGKSFDTFAPLGPWIVPADSLNANALEISMRVNGELRQSGNTKELMFPVDYLVSHLSRFCTLLPGDLIFTGTPSGVGAGRNPPVWLQPGDFMEVTISGIGSLRNEVAT